MLAGYQMVLRVHHIVLEENHDKQLLQGILHFKEVLVIVIIIVEDLEEEVLDMMVIRQVVVEDIREDLVQMELHNGLELEVEEVHI